MVFQKPSSGFWRVTPGAFLHVEATTGWEANGLEPVGGGGGPIDRWSGKIVREARRQNEVNGGVGRPIARAKLARQNGPHPSGDLTTMRRIAQLVLGSLAIVGSLFASSTASAGISACGNINVSAEARCEVVVEGGCTARCTPISFEAACYGRCDGRCTASVSAECTADCSASCQAECNVNPGSFDCEGTCRGNCQADCSGRCAAEGGSADCEAACKANCGGECNVQCSGQPPSADCNAQCSACCSGECRAEANFDCQVSCQGGCTAELEGGCQVQCTRPDGALFCDGQFVDAGNNLKECVAALNRLLNLKVQGYADASCSGNSCEAEAGVSVSACSVPAVGSDLDERGLVAVAAGLGLAMVVRRRRRG
ncbi:uncharacterized protein CMC5_006120 [Chondromyces crocatus]|uniref:Keratin associated protein n=1 Tax=Chondromyces crocatus TaxID=52 RepID=A0A0K1E6I8_CHOCO|nr:uncharacterized protein CMC5_006120 [Chondromyces crocatus]